MAWIPAYAIIFSIALAVVNWARTIRAAGRTGPWVGGLLVVALLVEISGLYKLMHGANNTPIYNLFMLVELALVLRVAGFVRPADHRWLLLCMGLGAAAMGANYFWQRNMQFLLTQGIVVVAILISTWCSLALWTLAKSTERPLWREPLFWFFLGTLLYCASIVPFVGVMLPLYKDNAELTRLLYRIIPAMAVTRYLFAAWAAHVAALQQRWDDER